MMNKTFIAFILAIGFLVAGYFFILSRESMTGYATSDSQTGNLSASVQTYMACTWSDSTLDVSFGSNLNPGSDDLNATDNYLLTPGTGYNVTVDALSTAAADVTISGNNLVSGANVIQIGNVTWASSETSATDALMVPGSSTPVTGSAVDIGTAVAVGSSMYYRLWLDVPSSTVAGDYVGNYTLSCQQAS